MPRITYYLTKEASIALAIKTGENRAKTGFYIRLDNLTEDERSKLLGALESEYAPGQEIVVETCFERPKWHRLDRDYEVVTFCHPLVSEDVEGAVRVVQQYKAFYKAEFAAQTGRIISAVQQRPLLDGRVQWAKEWLNRHNEAPTGSVERHEWQRIKNFCLDTIMDGQAANIAEKHNNWEFAKKANVLFPAAGEDRVTALLGHYEADPHGPSGEEALDAAVRYLQNRVKDAVHHHLMCAFGTATGTIVHTGARDHFDHDSLTPKQFEKVCKAVHTLLGDFAPTVFYGTRGKVMVVYGPLSPQQTRWYVEFRPMDKFFETTNHEAASE